MASDTRAAIIREASVMVDEGGEASLRVSRLAENVGVSIPSLYHHFSCRDEILAAVHATRYVELAAADSDVIYDLVLRSETRDDLAAALMVVTREVVSLTRAETRMKRAVALASSSGRPELREVITAETTRLVSQLSEAVLIAQRIGLADLTLNPRAIATFIVSYAAGLVAADMDGERVSDEELAQVIDAFVDRVVLAPPKS